MAARFGKVYRTMVEGRPNMNDFSMVTVGSPLELFDKVTFGQCEAEFAIDKVNDKPFRIVIDDEDDQLCDTVKGIDPADDYLAVDICRDKATVDDDASKLVRAVADDRDTVRVQTIEQAVALIRRNHVAPVQMVQCELGDGRIVCAKAGTFMMPSCASYRGFVCLNTNNVCVVLS